LENIWVKEEKLKNNDERRPEEVERERKARARGNWNGGNQWMREDRQEWWKEETDALC
jgi:hypothetical protein